MNIHAGGFILSKRRGKGNIKVAVEHRPLEPKPRGPTPERLAKAGDDVIRTVGAEGERIVVMRDAPLDRMYSRHAIDPVEYQALQKLKLHWHCSGMPGAIRSADLNRVFAADLSAMSHMAASEAQAHHRQQWRRAEAALSPRARIVVERVVCREQTIELAGYALGAVSKPQATAAASELLRDSGYRLAKLWGMH
jgi:hypothetical protein